MQSPSRPFRYSWEWSTTVVESFVEKYARATIFFGRIWGKSPGEIKYILKKICAEGGNRWRIVRDTIKWLEHHGEVLEQHKYTAKQWQNYLTSVKTIVEDYVIFEEKEYSAIDDERQFRLFS